MTNQSENEVIAKAIAALKEARRYIDRLTSDSSHAVDDLKDVDEALAALTARQEQPAREEAETLVKRLRNPPFGPEASERNLMASAADFIARHHLGEKS